MEGEKVTALLIAPTKQSTRTQNRKRLINGSNGSLTRHKAEEGNNDNNHHQHYDHDQHDDDDDHHGDSHDGQSLAARVFRDI